MNSQGSSDSATPPVVPPSPSVRRPGVIILPIHCHECEETVEMPIPRTVIQHHLSTSSRSASSLPGLNGLGGMGGVSGLLGLPFSSTNQTRQGNDTQRTIVLPCPECSRGCAVSLSDAAAAMHAQDAASPQTLGTTSTTSTATPSMSPINSLSNGTSGTPDSLNLLNQELLLGMMGMGGGNMLMMQMAQAQRNLTLDQILANLNTRNEHPTHPDYIEHLINKKTRKVEEKDNRQVCLVMYAGGDEDDVVGIAKGGSEASQGAGENARTQERRDLDEKKKSKGLRYVSEVIVVAPAAFGKKIDLNSDDVTAQEGVCNDKTNEVKQNEVGNKNVSSSLNSSTTVSTPEAIKAKQGRDDALLNKLQDHVSLLCRGPLVMNNPPCGALPFDKVEVKWEKGDGDGDEDVNVKSNKGRPVVYINGKVVSPSLSSSTPASSPDTHPSLESSGICVMDRGVVPFGTKYAIAKQRQYQALVVCQTDTNAAWPYTMTDSSGIADAIDNTTSDDGSSIITTTLTSNTSPTTTNTSLPSSHYNIPIPCVLVSVADSAELKKAMTRHKQAMTANASSSSSPSSSSSSPSSPFPPLRACLFIRRRAQTCPVCMLDFTPGDQATSLPCSHTFHQDCLVPWLKSNCTCPMCRHELPRMKPVETKPIEKIDYTEGMFT